MISQRRIEEAVYDLWCYLEEILVGGDLRKDVENHDGPLPQRPGYLMAKEVYLSLSQKWSKDLDKRFGRVGTLAVSSPSGVEQIEVVEPTESKVLTSLEINEAIEQLAQLPQCEMPLTHRFSPGIYMREIFMPAGARVVGAVHKTKHFNVILCGRAKVYMDGKVHEVIAPCVIESEAGVQKILKIEEDMRWMTIHANPSEERDIAVLENSLADFSVTPVLASKDASMPLDEFRMSLNTLQGKEESCPSL